MAGDICHRGKKAGEGSRKTATDASTLTATAHGTMRDMESFAADQIFVDAPPARVFRALTDPEDVLEWMDGTEARIAAGVGGEYSVIRADGAEISGRVARYEPDSLLEIHELYVDLDGTRRGPMCLRVELFPEDDGVYCHLRQEGLDSGPHWENFAANTRRELIAANLKLKRWIEGI